MGEYSLLLYTDSRPDEVKTQRLRGGQLAPRCSRGARPDIVHRRPIPMPGHIAGVSAHRLGRLPRLLSAAAPHLRLVAAMALTLDRWDVGSSGDESAELEGAERHPPPMPMPQADELRAKPLPRGWWDGMDWWKSPLMKSVREKRYDLGGDPKRPLQFATGCSGTESPAFGLTATRVAFQRWGQLHSSVLSFGGFGLESRRKSLKS